MKTPYSSNAFSATPLPFFASWPQDGFEKKKNAATSGETCGSQTEGRRGVEREEGKNKRRKNRGKASAESFKKIAVDEDESGLKQSERRMAFQGHDSLLEMQLLQHKLPVCECVCICVYIYIYIYIYICVDLYMCIYICMYTRIYIYIYIYIYVFVYVCVCECVCACVYVCV